MYILRSRIKMINIQEAILHHHEIVKQDEVKNYVVSRINGLGPIMPQTTNLKKQRSISNAGSQFDKKKTESPIDKSLAKPAYHPDYLSFPQCQHAIQHNLGARSLDSRLSWPFWRIPPSPLDFRRRSTENLYLQLINIS